MAPCGSEIRDQIMVARHVDRATLQRIEQTKGVVRGNFSNAIKIQEAIEQRRCDGWSRWGSRSKASGSDLVALNQVGPVKSQKTIH